MSKLEPVDKTRCQVDITPAHGPFQLGPRPRPSRCNNKPIVIATERKKGPDGKRGAMSICESCLAQFKKQMPAGFATLKYVRGVR